MSQIGTLFGFLGDGISVAEAGLILSIVLAAIRVSEYLDRRVRFDHKIARYYKQLPPHGDDYDDCYELLLTNVGGKTVTVWHVSVHPFKKTFGPFKRKGPGAMFLSDEMGLDSVTLHAGESAKFTFLHRDLHFAMNPFWTGKDEERISADGQLCEVWHTASRRPKTINLN